MIYQDVFHIKPSKITDVPQLQGIVAVLLNALENLHSEVEALKVENQELRDTINRLKGEQGKPDFGGKGDGKGRDISSRGKEKEKPKEDRPKGTEAPTGVEVDRKHPEPLRPDPKDMPADARPKFHKKVVVQDISFKRDNVEYDLVVYWSPAQNTTYVPPLPPEHSLGGYGSNLRSLIQVLHRDCNVTESGLERLLAGLGIKISAGTISNILLEAGDWACREREEILRAGMAGSPFAQTDSTQSKQKGVPMKTHIIGGMYFVAYFTLGSKARMDILRALLGDPAGGLTVTYNEGARSLLAAFGVSQRDRDRLSGLLADGQTMTLAAFDAMMAQQAPDIAAKKIIFARIRESLAIGHYHAQEDFPVVDILLSDNAPEYERVARLFHALCWIHDARHYNKLAPRFSLHIDLLEGFKRRYWSFYRKLLDYRNLPPGEQAARKKALWAAFDRLFKTSTGYDKLDELIGRTRAKKAELLAVLDCPALPLHNNAAELAARQVVRKRDISLHTWSDRGTKVRDAFMTIIETAKKLGVSTIAYINDRVSGKREMPSLASLVAEKYAA